LTFHISFAGNGKGVLKEMLQAATGGYYGTMSKDAVVTAPGQKPSSKNAPTNYIYDLMGVRLAVTDETAEGERVDLGLVLGMTGGGTTKARCLYGNPVDFTITHTPFVQTNYPPAMAATAIKENVARRLRVVPFPNSYVGADTFDPSNATHRLRDDGLKDRMKEEESLRQVLSWIARGSVEWYSSAKGLGPPSQAVKDATREYVSEADKLQNFLDHHCEVGEGFSTLQIEFATLYREFSSERFSNEELARRMEKKGFKRLKNNESPRQLYYPKIKCEYVI
jgi:putative DNA primase/helicase